MALREKGLLNNFDLLGFLLNQGSFTSPLKYIYIKIILKNLITVDIIFSYVFTQWTG